MAKYLSKTDLSGNDPNAVAMVGGEHYPVSSSGAIMPQITKFDSNQGSAVAEIRQPFGDVDDIDSIIQRKYDAQMTFAKAKYHAAMNDARVMVFQEGKQVEITDPALAALGTAELQNDVEDIKIWEHGLKGKMELIGKQETLTQRDKQNKIYEILGETKDAVLTPTAKKPKQLFSDSQILTTAGKMVNKITEGGTTSDAYGVANAELGFGWEQRYPELVELINSKTQAGGSEAGVKLSSKDQEAMKWAKANPKDPRAKKIMSKLTGIK